jgi:hypothetical protein
MNALHYAEVAVTNSLATLIVVGGTLAVLMSIVRLFGMGLGRITRKASGATRIVAPAPALDATKWDVYETPAFLRKVANKSATI